jgi:hypothetical protein
MFLRNEGSIHGPRRLRVLYCPFSDGATNYGTAETGFFDVLRSKLSWGER